MLQPGARINTKSSFISLTVQKIKFPKRLLNDEPGQEQMHETFRVKPMAELLKAARDLIQNHYFHAGSGATAIAAR